MKTNDNKTTIKIPSFDSISVGIGTVPVSGATASNQEIEKELKKAAREKIIPLPQDLSSEYKTS